MCCHWSERVPWERIVLGVAVIWGFVAIISWSLTHSIPSANREIVLSMVSVLGTALGAVVGAVFRSNNADETKNRTIETLANTAAAPITKTTTETLSDGQGTSTTSTEGSAPLAGATTGKPTCTRKPVAAEEDGDGGLPDLPPSQRPVRSDPTDGLGEEGQPRV